MTHSIWKWLLVVIIPSGILLTPVIVTILKHNYSYLWWLILSILVGFIMSFLSASMINLPPDTEEGEFLNTESDKTTP